MLKTLLKAVGFLTCVAWFHLASAASLGGINVTSALGHPLKAEISLAELGKTDKSTVVAKMASVNEFKNAGIDYPYSLPKLSFAVDTRSNGVAYVKLTSTQPVNEPFVSILIELSWPAGKLLREYTFLLDPAGFAAEQPKMAEVKPVEPMVPSAPEPLPAVAVLPLAKVNKEPVALPVAAAARPALVSTEQALAEPAEAVKVKPFAPSSQQALAALGSIVVEKGDTLANIADGVRPVDVSLERMLVAMYRANAQTFEGNNMNRIKAGKILRMPEAAEIENVTQKTAVKEIRAQVADWQNYRQKLAAAHSTSAEQAPKQAVVGKVSAAVAEKAPVLKDNAKEVLRLSKGETLGDKAIPGGGAKSKQETLTAKSDDAAAKSKQLQEEKKKISKLEEINKEASKLVELKGAPEMGLKSSAVEPKSVEKAPAAEGLPAVTAIPVTAAATEEFDILAMLNGYLAILLDDPMLLGAGVAVLLGLGGLGFIMARRGKGSLKTSEKKEKIGKETIGEVTGSWRTPVVPSPDTGDFTNAASVSMSVDTSLDDVDPISEADLFLNFGRDAQAEEILKDALAKNSSNIQVKLKLLSIYLNRKDSKTFSKYAQEIKDSGDVAAWERAAVMGREVDPSNPTYGGDKGEVRHREPPKAEVDFDLGLGNAASSVGDAAAAMDFKMDFDVTDTPSSAASKSTSDKAPLANSPFVAKAQLSAEVDATSILSKDVINAAQKASPMDFDVSGILPGDVKEVTQASTMDFDLSGEIPVVANKPVASSSSMDFDLSDDIIETASVLQGAVAKPEAASTGMNFDDLIFEIPTSQSAPVQETQKEVADDSMPFTIDFPTSDNLGSTSAKPEAAKNLDINFGDININLDEDSPPVHAGGEGKGEQWHEVATKLDLAKAYQEMGDADGAREILEEVIRDGDATQRESAEKLLNQITV